MIGFLSRRAPCLSEARASRCNPATSLHHMSPGAPNQKETEAPVRRNLFRTVIASLNKLARLASSTRARGSGDSDGCDSRRPVSEETRAAAA